MPRTLDNIYYDTGDLSLRRRGIALRLRRKGKLWLQTVKLAGTAAAGLSSRPEWETPYGGHFDFSAIEQAERCANGWNGRSCWRASSRSAKRVSAALPGSLPAGRRGAADAGSRLDRSPTAAAKPISEVELELAGAPVQAIFDLAAQLAERVALTPAVLSKAERGYRLHSRHAAGAGQSRHRTCRRTCRPSRPFAASRCPASNTCSRTTTAPCQRRCRIHPPDARRNAAPARGVAAVRARPADGLPNPCAAAGRTDDAAGLARDLDVLLAKSPIPVLCRTAQRTAAAALASDITNRATRVRRRLALLAAPRLWAHIAAGRAGIAARRARADADDCAGRLRLRAPAPDSRGSCGAWLAAPTSTSRPRCMPCASASSACATRWNSSPPAPKRTVRHAPA
jgi:hypothetical protein